MARNVALTGSATNRRFVWSPVDPGWWQHLGEVVGEWIVPGRIVRVLQTSHVPTGLAALAFVCLIVAAARVGSRGSDGRPVLGWEWIPLLAWLGGHVALLVVSTATGYPPPDIDTRTLAPVFAGLLILLAASLVLAGTTAPSWIRGAAIVVAIGFLVFKGYAARDLIQRLARDGQGYTSAAWSNSAALEALVRAEPGVVYADDTGAVYYFTGRPAFQVPVRFDPVTGEERPSYRSEVCLMRTRLREDEGLLVLFGSEATGRPPGDSDDLLRGLEPVVEGPGGAVFRDGSGTLHECDSARLRERGPALARVPMTPEGAG
jgi:hypothetical protein